MSNLARLHEDLTVCMNQVAKVMRHYNYDATPTLVLRHKDGSSYSILLGNDDLAKVVKTISDLGGPEVVR